ncbi:MAG: hypothetical protein V5B44_23905 [Candidatus Accumulibacter necessarius]
MDTEVADRHDRTKRPSAVVVVEYVLVILVLIAGHQLDKLEIEAAADVPFVDVVTGSTSSIGKAVLSAVGFGSEGYVLTNLVNGVEVEGTGGEIGTDGVSTVISWLIRSVVVKVVTSGRL